MDATGKRQRQNPTEMKFELCNDAEFTSSTLQRLFLLLIVSLSSSSSLYLLFAFCLIGVIEFHCAPPQSLQQSEHRARHTERLSRSALPLQLATNQWSTYWIYITVSELK